MKDHNKNRKEEKLKRKYILILDKFSERFGHGPLTECLNFYHVYGYRELNSDQIKFYLVNILKVSEEVLS